MDRDTRSAPSPLLKSRRPKAPRKAWTTHPPLAHPRPRDASSLRHERALHDVEGLSPSQLRETYHFIYLTRRLEEHLVALKRQNHVVGSVYRSLGQEATAVGCAYAMAPGDCVQPLIRDLGALLVHGVRPVAVFRQYLARATGPTAGRDLNVHFSCPSRGIIGPVSMLGTCIPVVAGALLAARVRGKRQAGLAFIGDGGSSTGAFYEGMNFAAVQRLPMVVVVEANGYAFSTATSAQLPHGDLLCRTRGFGVPVTEVDGNDVLACYGATQEARWRALRGDGPSILLAHTYRRLGHTDHDGGSYVDAAEMHAWGERNDPLARLHHHLVHGHHVAQRELTATEQAVEALLEESRSTAMADPLPDATHQPHGVWSSDPQAPLPSPDTWLGEGAQHRAQATDSAAPTAAKRPRRRPRHDS